MMKLDIARVENNKIIVTSISPFSTIALAHLLDNKILDWSKLKEIADDILKCI